MSYESKSFADTYADALYGMARFPAAATNSFGTGVNPDRFTSDYLNEFSNRLSGFARGAVNLGSGAGGAPTVADWVPGYRNLFTAIDPNSDMTPVQRGINAAAGVGAAAIIGGPASLSRVFPKFGQRYLSIPPVIRRPLTLGTWMGSETATNKLLPEQYRQSPPNIFDAAQRSWEQTQQAASIMGTNAPRTVPMGAPERSWAQTQLAGALMGTNVTKPSLTPSEIEYFAQQQRDLRRRAGQASAQDALQMKQARQEAQRQIADLNAFISASPLDVAAQTTALGPAAELGFMRTVEREGEEKIGDVRQNLKDFLARQRLSAGQRGANLSAGMTDIERAKAASLADREQDFIDILFGGRR